MDVHAIESLRAIHGGPDSAAAKSASTGGAAFQNLLGDLLGNEAAASAKADRAVEALATGKSDSLHSVSLAVAQADLNFRLILEMRNRLVEAYQEVMRMQV